MKKLLIITDMYPDSRNPVNGVFVQQQVRELSRYYQIMVIATSFSHPFHIVRTHEDKIGLLYVSYPVWRFAHVVSPLSYYRYCIPVIKHEIVDFSPDIIHVHDCRHHPELYCLSCALRSYKGRKLLTLHNIRTHPAEIVNPLSRIVYRQTLNKALWGWDKIITVNNRLAGLVANSECKHSVMVMGNAIVAVDRNVGLHSSESSGRIMDFISRKSNETGVLKLIAVGNLVPTKGFDLLLQALADVKQKGVSFLQVIIGGGGSEAELRSLVQSLGLQEDVLLAGMLPNEEVRTLYSCFDAFVLPSWKETFGIVYLEAMETGLITVGVQGQGIDGVIKNRVNGILIAPHDVRAISNIVIDIAQNIAKYAELREAGKQTVVSGYMMDGLITRLRKEYNA